MANPREIAFHVGEKDGYARRDRPSAGLAAIRSYPCRSRHDQAVAVSHLRQQKELVLALGTRIGPAMNGVLSVRRRRY